MHVAFCHDGDVTMVRWYIAVHGAFCHDGDVTMVRLYMAMHDATMAIKRCYNALWQCMPYLATMEILSAAVAQR